MYGYILLAGSPTDSASGMTDGQTPTQTYSQTPTHTPTATQSQPITRLSFLTAALSERITFSFCLSVQ